MTVEQYFYELYNEMNTLELAELYEIFTIWKTNKIDRKVIKQILKEREE